MPELNVRTVTRTAIRTPQPVVVSNYTDEDISTLFSLNWIQRNVLFKKYKSQARRLYALGLSYGDSLFLLQTKKLSVKEVEQCYKKLGLEVKHIRVLDCSKEKLFGEVPELIKTVGDAERFKTLLDHSLSLANIQSLFGGEKKLCYEDTISLIRKNYTADQLLSLLAVGFKYSDLSLLADMITASEVYALFKKDKQNLVFLLSVTKILKKNVADLDSAVECYEILYNNIPTSLYDSLVAVAAAIPPEYSDTDDAGLTYEEILMNFMDIAGGRMLQYGGGVETAIKTVNVIADKVSALAGWVSQYADEVPELFKALEKVIKFFTPSRMQFIEEYIPVKPFFLAALWFSQDILLAKKYLNNANSLDEKILGKFILSFMVSSMCGVTGYLYSGGNVPSGSVTVFAVVTRLIKTLFTVQLAIKEYAPRIYEKIPKELMFESNDSFEDLIEEKQISAAMGMTMIYTFRVGNAFLCNLFSEKVFTFESAKNIFKSLWPLPQETESIRMYFIYSGIPIYTTLDLKDVFVSIPKN